MKLRDKIMDQARRRYFSDLLFRRRDRVEKACLLFKRWIQHEENWRLDALHDSFVGNTDDYVPLRTRWARTLETSS